MTIVTDTDTMYMPVPTHIPTAAVAHMPAAVVKPCKDSSEENHTCAQKADTGYDLGGYSCAVANRLHLLRYAGEQRRSQTYRKVGCHACFFLPVAALYSDDKPQHASDRYAQ